MTKTARTVPDTDWHMRTLYDFAEELGASIIRPLCSRYVVDLNRPADGSSLYPGQRVTELCPTWMFDGEPVYQPGQEPNAAEIHRRVDIYWHPYHQKVRAELERLRLEHGVAMLFEAHSIRGVLPELFEGKLPDLNLGTARGTSLDPARRQRVMAALDSAASAAGFTAITDGRFVGGHITRHYGQPARGVEAVQMELVQATYMDEDGPPFSFRPDRAARIRPVLDAVMAAFSPIFQVWRTDADPRCFDLSLDPSDRAYGTLWGANQTVSRIPTLSRSPRGTVMTFSTSDTIGSIRAGGTMAIRKWIRSSAIDRSPTKAVSELVKMRNGKIASSARKATFPAMPKASSLHSRSTASRDLPSQKTASGRPIRAARL